ncbi:MAG: hypothetical protein ACJ75H_05495 [Thermoanaerobaculia bacterium]
MSSNSTTRLTLILALIAAILAFSAAYIRYSKTGEVAVTPIGGGALMLVLAAGAYAKLRQTGAGS